MDEKVLQDLFNRAVSKGYNKSIKEFTLLLNEDNDVLNDNYNYVKEQGYQKSIEDFKVLTGAVEGVKAIEPIVKKKDEPASTSQEEVMESVTPTEQEEVGSLVSSAPSPLDERKESERVKAKEYEQSTQEGQFEGGEFDINKESRASLEQSVDPSSIIDRRPI